MTQTQIKRKHESEVCWLMNKLWELSWKGFSEDEVKRAIAIRDNYPEAPAAPPVSDAVELVEYTKWVRENWIVGSNETWRRQADYRDKRTDNALVTEYKLSSTITKKQ